MMYSNRSVELVVLTIGTDEEVTTELLNAVHNRNWSASEFHFDKYLSAPRRPSIGQDISTSKGCLAFVDYDRLPDEAAETSRYLSRAFPGRVLIVAVGRRLTSSVILSAMRAGCGEYLPKHSPQSALDSILDRFEAIALAEAENLQSTGKVLAVLGAKGGVGTTSMAVHLATFLAERHRKHTLLIDQQRHLGHVCVYMGIDCGNHTFHEAVRNIRRMDSELLEGFVARHSSGLEIMTSPDTLLDDRLLQPQDVGRTLEFLKDEFDYIVVDCDRTQPDILPIVLKAASEVYLVAMPEVASIRDLSRLIDGLLLAEVPAEKLRLVINRHNMPHAILPEQIEKALKLPVTAQFPDATGEMIHAGNAGRPLVHTGNSELTQAFSRWSDRIAGIAVKTSTKDKEKKVLSRWRQAMPAW